MANKNGSNGQAQGEGTGQSLLIVIIQRNPLYRVGRGYQELPLKASQSKVELSR